MWILINVDKQNDNNDSTNYDKIYQTLTFYVFSTVEAENTCLRHTYLYMQLCNGNKSYFEHSEMTFALKKNNMFLLSFCYRISHVKFIKIKLWAKQIFSLPCWMLQHAWNLWIFSTENEKWCESEKNLNCLLVHEMKETKRFRLFIWAAHFSTPHIPYSPQRHIQIQFILPFYHFQLCWLRVM